MIEDRFSYVRWHRLRRRLARLSIDIAQKYTWAHDDLKFTAKVNEYDKCKDSRLKSFIVTAPVDSGTLYSFLLFGPSNLCSTWKVRAPQYPTEVPLGCNLRRTSRQLDHHNTFCSGIDTRNPTRSTIQAKDQWAAKYRLLSNERLTRRSHERKIKREANPRDRRKKLLSSGQPHRKRPSVLQQED